MGNKKPLASYVHRAIMYETVQLCCKRTGLYHADHTKEMEANRLKAFYKVPEVQQILNMGRTKVYELIRSGVIPSVDIDGNIRIPVEALEKWIKRKVESSTTQTPQESDDDRAPKRGKGQSDAN